MLAGGNASHAVSVAAAQLQSEARRGHSAALFQLQLHSCNMQGRQGHGTCDCRSRHAFPVLLTKAASAACVPAAASIPTATACVPTSAAAAAAACVPADAAANAAVHPQVSHICGAVHPW